MNTQEIRRHLTIYLIKPSLYDEEGYVIRYKYGVLPSNTLACLNGLTEGLRENKALGTDVQIDIHLLDEFVDRVDPEQLSARARRLPGVKLFCLCGVQSNQFPRASDIALALRSAGFPVVLGGFHVSGIFSVFGKLTPELQTLQDSGVNLVAGEVEEAWPDILRDALNARLKSFYNFLEDRPALDTPFLPILTPGYLKKFAISSFGTLDCGRGCPFRCSFCTVINVHGLAMRRRNISCLRDHLIRNYRQNRIYFYFFTDDNFARNPAWREIFDLLIELQGLDIHLQFLMQVDTQAYKIPGFLERAVQAGCTQVFIGMESLNEQNLASVGKKQNKVSNYAEMIRAWKRRGVMTHVGYIIGFPYDSPESVEKDIKTLAYHVSPDLASFFVLTPLPGSEDHRQITESRIPMKEDLNLYDSCHPVTDHPLMTQKQWKETYEKSWHFYYSRNRMAHVLRHLKGWRARDMLGSFIWYKYSIKVHRTHPMICGFHRLKDRRIRRSGLVREGRLRFILRRFRENTLELFRTAILGLEFLILYLQFWPNLQTRADRTESRLGDERQHPLAGKLLTE